MSKYTHCLSFDNIPYGTLKLDKVLEKHRSDEDLAMDYVAECIQERMWTDAIINAHNNVN